MDPSAPAASAAGAAPSTVTDEAASGHWLVDLAQAIWRHPRRTLAGGVRSSRPSPSERRALVDAGIVDPLMQGYMAWRHSLLLVATPITLLSGGLAVWDLLTDDDIDGLTTLGVIAHVVPSIAVLVLMATTVAAALTWRRLRRSARIVQTGWAISLFVPVAVALVPVHWLFDESRMNRFGPDTELGVRLLTSVTYAVSLVPILLSFPSGVVRGAARIKSLLPMSTLAGWVLVILTPIYAFFFVVALIVVEQVGGNSLLLVGIALLTASPFVHVFAARLYVLPLTTDGLVRRLATVQRWAGLLTVSGAVLIVVWALTARFADSPIVGSAGDDALIDHNTAVLGSLELIGRVLITTAVFSHLLLQMTEASWRIDRGVDDPDAARRHQEQMEQVDRTLRAAGDRVG